MTVARTAKDFWRHVDKSGTVPAHNPALGPCWLWTGGADPDGYGLVTGPDGTKRAHRAGYVFQCGPIPDGAFVCHKCDVPGCVRGEHLYAGNAFTNAIDVGDRGSLNARSGDDHPSRFYMFPQRRSDEQIASSLFWLETRASLGLTQAQLARAIGCSEGSIARAERGRTIPRKISKKLEQYMAARTRETSPTQQAAHD